MLLSAVSVLVVAQASSEDPEGLMNNPVFVNNSSCLSVIFSCNTYGREVYTGIWLESLKGKKQTW